MTEVAEYYLNSLNIEVWFYTVDDKYMKNTLITTYSFILNCIQVNPDCQKYHQSYISTLKTHTCTGMWANFQRRKELWSGYLDRVMTDSHGALTFTSRKGFTPRGHANGLIPVSTGTPFRLLLPLFRVTAPTHWPKDVSIGSNCSNLTFPIEK